MYHGYDLPSLVSVWLIILDLMLLSGVERASYTSWDQNVYVENAKVIDYATNWSYYRFCFSLWEINFLMMCLCDLVVNKITWFTFRKGKFNGDSFCQYS